MATIDITKTGIFNSANCEPVAVTGKFTFRRGLVTFLVKVRVISCGTIAETVGVGVSSDRPWGDYVYDSIDLQDFLEDNGREFDNDDLDSLIYRLSDKCLARKERG